MEHLTNIIAEISKIEDRATSLIQSANNEKTLLAQQHEQRIKEFDLNLQKKTQDQVNSIHEDLNKSMRTELDLQRAKTNDLLVAMQSEYDKNHNAIAKQLVKSMIGA